MTKMDADKDVWAAVVGLAVVAALLLFVPRRKRCLECGGEVEQEVVCIKCACKWEEECE